MCVCVCVCVYVCVRLCVNIYPHKENAQHTFRLCSYYFN